ncbi:alpha/beta hydrolase [Kribbella sp. NBC_01245]|uniref:alpha/beta fold hydrolase n=1 Tax=Kribbella sp. NBC_01245 TaxID=2903578 RepID=UPI002E2E0073|nr:alpha/beta hydrolase [Kribbella sp. NBC_01245]
MGRSRLLLVHGWGADRRSWDDIAELVAPWADVLAPDLAGHGEAPAASGLTIDQLADDLAELVADGGPVVAVGHSMGGQVVVSLAARYPELVQAIVVIDPAYGADEAEIAHSPDVLADLRRRGTEAGVEFVDRALAGNALHEEVRAQMSRTPGSVLADLFESMYLAPGSIGARAATRAFQPRLTQPCLSLYSTESAADFARSLTWPAGSAIEVWPGATHYLHQQYPRRFAELLRRQRLAER